MSLVRAHAWPRAGLLGNPSDLYGGRGLGFAFDAFRAEVELEPAGACDFASPLLAAAWRALGDPELPPCRARFRSEIPHQVGLAGSSAIVVAMLRACECFYGFRLTPSRRAELAWRAEQELLGIRAGPMDRLIQSHEGLVALDFARPWAGGAVERLDPALLPPLRIGWDPAPGQPSGEVHEAVWQRWRAGERLVHETLAAFRPLVERGLAALRRGDRAALRACVDENFELRALVFPIGARDRRLIRLARAAGGAAKLCGSGGAVLAVLADEAAGAALEASWRAEGFATIAPRVVER